MKSCGLVTPCFSHRSEEHTSELQSHEHLVCRLLLEKKQHRLDGIFPARASLLVSGIVCAVCASHTSMRRVSRQLKPPLPAARSRSQKRFFFKDPATPAISALSLHDALPI